jgi:hypothetical protein
MTEVRISNASQHAVLTLIAIIDNFVHVGSDKPSEKLHHNLQAAKG